MEKYACINFSIFLQLKSFDMNMQNINYTVHVVKKSTSLTIVCLQGPVQDFFTKFLFCDFFYNCVEKKLHVGKFYGGENIYSTNT